MTSKIRARATRSGLAVSEIGLGAAQLGNLGRVTSDEDVAETVVTAWDAGIRYFDTAPHYGVGLSERRLGETLRKCPRNEYVISTKVGRLLVPSPETARERDPEGFDVPADPRRQWDFSRDGILRSVESSLKRTGLDRFDVLYLHDPENHFEQASTEGISTLIELRDQGVVSAVGAGMNFAAPLAELIRRADIDLVMCAGRFSLLDGEALHELLPLALEREVGVVAAAVYNSGLLASVRPRSDATYNYLPAPPELIERATQVARVAEAHGVTLPELALAYVLRHPAVISVVVGARGRTQVKQNVDRYATPVPEIVWRQLDDAGLIQEFDQ